MASPVPAPDPLDVPLPITVPVDGYGDLVIVSSRDEEVVKSLTHVELPRLTRNIDGQTDAPWKLSLFPDEAIDFAMALIAHARELLT